MRTAIERAPGVVTQTGTVSTGGPDRPAFLAVSMTGPASGLEILSDIEAEASRSAGRPEVTVEAAFLAASCMASAPTLAKAIDRGSRFYATLARAAGCPGRTSMKLEVSAKAAELRFYSGAPAPSAKSCFMSAVLGAAYHVKLLGWLVGDEVKVISGATSYRQMLSREALEEIVSWPIAFGVDLGTACDFSVTFPVRYLSLPVIRTGSELEAVNLLGLTFAAAPHASTAMTVRRILSGALRRGGKLPSASRLASLCNRSPATLRRHLACEKTSIREIREECIRERALQLLRDRSIPLGEVAARLGFSDAPCFRRAFRRWTGSSPAAYRRRLIPFQQTDEARSTP